MKTPALGIALAASLLAGCAPLVTQSPGQGLSPVNAVAESQDKHLMLAGHDVVSYFTKARHERGDPAIKSVHKGVTFRFASAEHKRLFDAAPEKYIPQYGGYCTNGIVYAVPWGGNVNSWQMMDGKLYMFGGQGSMDAFNLRPRENLALADKYWAEEVSGSNAFWQRTKRTTWGRLPHYKSGEELAAEVAAAKAARR